MTLSNNGPLDAADYNEPLDELEAHLTEIIALELDDASAAKLNDVVKEIQSLTKAANKDRVAIKQPHLDAGRQVDDDFRPVLDRGKSLAQRGKDAATAYMVEQRRIAEEARRKAEEEAARKARIAEELANDALIGDDVAREAKDASLALITAEAEASTSGRLGSMSGQSRVMSLRVSYKAEIEDADKAAAYFASHPKVQEAILVVANQILRSPDRPQSIAGIKINKIERAA